MNAITSTISRANNLLTQECRLMVVGSVAGNVASYVSENVDFQLLSTTASNSLPWMAPTIVFTGAVIYARSSLLDWAVSHFLAAIPIYRTMFIQQNGGNYQPITLQAG